MLVLTYETLIYLISTINYGGRVTDDKDERLISAILKRYFNPQAVETDNYKYSSDTIYVLPSNLQLDAVRGYIDNHLPLIDDPEVFGLHPNANITF
jgi:dynein heavy chain, axonemal